MKTESDPQSELMPFRCLRALDEIRALLVHARTDAVDLVDLIHRATEKALFPAQPPQE